MQIWPESSLIKNRLFIVLCCLIAGAAVAPIPKHLTITKTRSVDPRLFWTSEVKGFFRLEAGTYIRARISVDFPGHRCDNCLVVKRVGCAPGSFLETKGRGFYCDGTLIGSSKREIFQTFNQILGPGEVFLIGDNPRSYDSRYFGLVKTNAIDAKLYPIFSGALLVLLLSVAVQANENESGQDANKGEGFYWYHDRQQSEENTEPPTLSYQELWNMHPDDFAQLLEDRKKLAIQFPTEENVYHYLEVQDVAKRKSLAFAAVMGLVAQKHPEFSSENNYPLNVPGQRALTRAKTAEQDSYLGSIREQYALIVFMQQGCEFCQAQKPIVDMFAHQYGWLVRFLDLGEYRHIADRYSITMTPSILVVSRDQQEAMPLASGIVSLAELRQRLVRSVKYLRGEVKPEQFFPAKGTSDPLKFVARKEEDHDE